MSSSSREVARRAAELTRRHRQHGHVLRLRSRASHALRRARAQRKIERSRDWIHQQAATARTRARRAKAKARRAADRGRRRAAEARRGEAPHR